MLKFIGLLLPALIDFINSKVASSTGRFWISAAVCTVVGVLVNFVEMNGLSGYAGLTMLQTADSLSESALMVFGLAQLSYKAVWENSDMRADLKSALHLN